MCTVSFVFSDKKVIFTHNRDEKVARPSAIEPKEYLVNNKKIFFPKDPKAGGTWYAISEQGTIAVLLNGAEEKHEVKLPYRKSRGLILLDIISSESANKEWQNIDLENIEPFTLVLYQNQELYQLRWNGLQKSTLQLDKTKSHIWSSSTLYPKNIRENRDNWFHAFLNTKLQITEDEMYNFHRYTENDNTENGLIINRNDMMKTLSITQAIVQEKKVTLHHHDLISKKDFTTTVSTF